MPVNRGRSQFQGLFSEMWSVSETVDFGNAATGLGTFASADVTVPGVALGDIVMGISAGVDTVDTVIGGAVTAANTVTLTVLNNTAGAVDLTSTTLKFIVVRPAF
jgi:hypothetical protein